jgi:hypothetical protein
VFQAARGMTELARQSTGESMKAAVLGAVRAAAGERAASAREHLAELDVLLSVADDLGDVGSAESAAIRAALATARGAVSPA